MNRRDFLKSISLAAIGVAVGVKAVEQISAADMVVSSIGAYNLLPIIYGDHGIDIESFDSAAGHSMNVFRVWTMDSNGKIQSREFSETFLKSTRLEFYHGMLMV